MAQPDEAHVWTDEELSKLERRIRAEYKKASKELQGTIDDYFAKLKKRDEEMKALLDAGEITENHYKQWRLAQIGRGERYEALRDKIAERITRANETAVAYVNDATPGIYSLNRNYAAYTIEQVAGNADFTLWDEQTVKRLLVEQPDLMPYYPKKKAVKRGIDLAWGKKQITNVVTSGILQGKSIKGLADDLQARIPTMNRDSAIRTARTAVTGAQNAGRMDSYAAAKNMGIELQKEWLATLDNRTRHEHAMLDGQRVDNDKPFEVDGYKLMFPGDPSGEPHLIYNCRCTMIAAVKGIDTSDALRRDRDGLLPDMTYAQWETSKRGYEGKQLSPYRAGNDSRVKDVSKKYLEKAQPRMGKVRYENGYKLGGHSREIAVAKQINNLFGGKIVLLKESNAQNMKTPDYLWRGKQWELKSISTGKAGDMAIRSAVKQINGNPGGVVLQCAESIQIDDLIRVIDARALRNILFNFDVIALREDGTLMFARRYKK